MLPGDQWIAPVDQSGFALGIHCRPIEVKDWEQVVIGNGRELVHVLEWAALLEF